MGAWKSYYEVFPSLRELAAQLMALDMMHGGWSHERIMRLIEGLDAIGEWANVSAAIEIGCYDPDKPTNDDPPWDDDGLVHRCMEIMGLEMTDENVIELRRRFESFGVAAAKRKVEFRQERRARKAVEDEEARQQGLDQMDDELRVVREMMLATAAHPTDSPRDLRDHVNETALATKAD